MKELRESKPDCCEMDKEEYCLNLESHIATLVNRFRSRAYNFFTEADIHSYLYLSLYRDKEFSRQHTTVDRKRTILVHREYPTFLKFKKVLPLEVSEDGARGHYDIAVLNPDFVASYPLETIINKDISTVQNEWRAKPLLAAIEFKFVVDRLGSALMKEIEMDFQKLSLSDDHAENLYMVIFNRACSISKEVFEEFKRFTRENKAVKSIYAESFVADDEKKLYRGHYFGNWLKKAKLPRIGA